MSKFILAAIALSSVLVFSNNARAGIRETGGVTAPVIAYGCYDMGYDWNSQPNFEVTVGSEQGNPQLMITVVDLGTGTVANETVVSKASETVGGGLTYVGATIELTIATTASPIIEGTHISSYAYLTKLGSATRELKCEATR